MERIVIDTNILVSSAISPIGNPANIMMLVSYKELHLFYTAQILDEYKRVLAYEKLNISLQAQSNAIKGILMLGELIEPNVSTIPIPDETDRIFYDAAQASGAFLITGNIKHFPAEPFIMTTADFLEKIVNK